ATVAQAAVDQAASDQATASQATFDLAADSQAAEAKTFDPSDADLTNWFSPAFGFGSRAVPPSPRAFGMFSSPTPREPLGAPVSGVAVSISAPFTWSGVHVGFLSMIMAAAPATIGAENDVPLSFMYPGAVTFVGRSAGSTPPAGT